MTSSISKLNSFEDLKSHQIIHKLKFDTNSWSKYIFSQNQSKFESQFILKVHG